MGGWDVPTEYLVAPVLIWTGLGCDNNTYPPNPTQIHSLQIKLSLNINKLKEVVNKNKNDRGRMVSDSPMGHALYVYCASTVTSLNTGRFIIDKKIVVTVAVVTVVVVTVVVTVVVVTVVVATVVVTVILVILAVTVVVTDVVTVVATVVVVVVTVVVVTVVVVTVVVVVVVVDVIVLTE